MQIALCLICKDENEYLQEWIDYHINVGIDYFIIYDNNSKYPISKTIEKLGYRNVTVISWKEDKTYSQVNAYMHCCQNFQNYDYIGFIDTDEFYESISMNIKQDFQTIIKNKEVNGLSLFWRFYGSFPYFTDRQPIENYTQWVESDGIKSFLNPKKVEFFYHPHAAKIKGIYIDELNRGEIHYPKHTSNFFWIKHVYTRSLSEWGEKIKRGDVNNKEKKKKTVEEFYEANNLIKQKYEN